MLECLFSRSAPLRFIPMKLLLDFPSPPARTVCFETLGREQEIRLHFIMLLQQRAFSLPQRLLHLKAALHAMEIALNDKDCARVNALLAGAPLDALRLSSMPEEHMLLAGLDIIERLMELVDARSVSVREYGKAALTRFRSGNPMDAYCSARKHFEQTWPDWPIYLEHLLVNHMFFERFPFQDRPESLSDEWIALCAIYAMLRFLTIGNLADKHTQNDFVDVAAAAFRLIAHTSFDRYAIHVLKEQIHCDEAELLQLLLL